MMQLIRPEWFGSDRLIWNQTIHGQLYSMKNRRKIVKIRTKAGATFTKVVMSSEASQYIQDFKLQARKPLAGTITDDVLLAIRVFYQSRRSDVDIELVKDCLQHSGIIENDRQIRSMWIDGMKTDKLNPRVEIYLYLCPTLLLN